MDAQKIVPAEITSASKKLPRDAAVALAQGASRVIVAKGKQVRVFETAGKAPKAAVDAMLGPTGNLRAPVVRVGKTVLVGFDEERWSEALR